MSVHCFQHGVEFVISLSLKKIENSSSESQDDIHASVQTLVNTKLIQLLVGTMTTFRHLLLCHVVRYRVIGLVSDELRSQNTVSFVIRVTGLWETL